MIISFEQMRTAERRAFDCGVLADDLMADAAVGIAEIIKSIHPQPGILQIFYGKGHNGGDALAAGLHLRNAGWVVTPVSVYAEEDLAPLTRLHLRNLRNARTPIHPPSPFAPRVVLDGLLGAGTAGIPREPAASAIRRINQLRSGEGCHVVAIDTPSGLRWSGPDELTVRADVTCCPGAVKDMLLADSATDVVGRLYEVPLQALTPFLEQETSPDWDVITARRLRPLLSGGGFDRHKGDAGRVAIVAGAPGRTGAAILAAVGALRGGAGLVTILAPEPSVQILRAAAPPEIMVACHPGDPGYLDTTDAIVFGCGLGGFASEWLSQMAALPQPMVIDADGLNAIAEKGAGAPPQVGPRLYTPHPGEFRRLAPDLLDLDRAAAARTFASRHPNTTLLLKGARSLVATQGRPLFHNTTGHPGMATAGMGDFLAGIAAARLASGQSPHEAAMIAAWVCGRAAELAILTGESRESLTAGTLFSRIGAAFESIRLGWG